MRRFRALHQCKHIVILQQMVKLSIAICLQTVLQFQLISRVCIGCFGIIMIEMLCYLLGCISVALLVCFCWVCFATLHPFNVTEQLKSLNKFQQTRLLSISEITTAPINFCIIAADEFNLSLATRINQGNNKSIHQGHSNFVCLTLGAGLLLLKFSNVVVSSRK